MTDEIEIEPYNPNWPNLFQEEKSLLSEILKSDNLLEIRHFGSTSVPGISAKPIIDIMVIVKSLEVAKAEYLPLMESINYIYWPEDHLADSRMWFVKGMPPYGKKRTHHVHIVQEDNPDYIKRLKFCEYLRNNKAIADEYAELKIKLASKHTNDREAYTDAKADFIIRINNSIT